VAAKASWIMRATSPVSSFAVDDADAPFSFSGWSFVECRIAAQLSASTTSTWRGIIAPSAWIHSGGDRLSTPGFSVDRRIRHQTPPAHRDMAVRPSSLLSSLSMPPSVRTVTLNGSFRSEDGLAKHYLVCPATPGPAGSPPPMAGSLQ
jgi:hypothetical protein